MGFYGNIKNTSRTQFNFDKVYASRVEMDNSCQNDGVYAGRYVLVEYDQKINFDAFPVGYLKDGILYASIPTGANGTPLPYRLTGSPDAENGNPGVFVNPGTIIHVPEHLNFDNDWDVKEEIIGGNIVTKTYPSSILYVVRPVELFKEDVKTYIIDPETYELVENVDNQGEVITIKALNCVSFTKLTPLTSDYAGVVQGVEWQNAYDNFTANFAIDRNTYGAARGYDSTVWQKVYTGSSSKYVMVAELNSVVPTFDIAADAPSQMPILPHFDADSTNIYYRLHLQPQWGFRIKNSDPTLKTPALNSMGETIFGNFVEGSTDVREFPSDQTTTWKNITYNAVSGEANELVFITDDGNGNPAWVPAVDVRENNNQIGAAIYFNKDGFNPNRISYSGDKEYAGWADNNFLVKDEILLSPTGRSGHYYNSHNGLEAMDMLPDTQELSIMLPSIGDSMAAIWDLIYGGRNIDPNAEYRNTNIYWYNAKAVSNKDGLRMINRIAPGQYTYNTAAASTVAGILNSAQDLMGMIITDEFPTDPATANSEYIYYDSSRKNYFYKHKTYEYTPVNFTNNKIPSDYDVYAPVEDLKKWDKAYFYIDTATKNGWEFVLEDKFYEDRKYIETYKVENAMKPVALSAAYAPDGTFFYRQRDSYPSVNGIPGASYNYYVASFEEYNPEIDYYEFTPSQTQVQENEAIYIPNTYYYITYLPVALTNVTYEPNVYYFVNYIDNTGVPHYLLAEGETMDDNVNANGEIVKQYLKRTYTLETSLSKRDLVYYRVLPNSGQNSNAYYKQNKRAIDAGEITYNDYTPNNYYYRVDALSDVPGGAEFELIGTIVYVRDDATYASEDDFNATGRHYYKIEIEYELVQGEDVIEITDENAIMVEHMRDMNEFKIDNGNNTGTGIFYIYVDSEGAQRYIEVNYNNFAKAYNAVTQKYEFIIMDFKLIGEPYNPNSYYYKVTDSTSHKLGSFLIDDRKSITQGRQYYLFEPTEGVDYSGQLLDGYFVEGKYYREDPPGSGNYVEAKDETELEQGGFDLSKALYVISDEEKIYEPGAVWPMEVKQIPNGVQLGTREDVWELAPFEGFADNINTLHGLLLRLHNYLNEKDTLTRDTNTARGSVNLFKDLLDKFATLAPAEITVVDDYGRMHSAKHSTSQALTYSKITDSTVSTLTPTKAAAENALITLAIDSDFRKPKITFTHSNANTIANTTSKRDMNTNASDVLVIETPLIDNAGHVVGKNSHSATLPFGFKKFTPANSDSLTSQLTGSNVETIIATNTQDTLQVSSVNKWIKVESSGKNLKFSHTLVSTNFGELKNNQQDSTPKFGDTFNIPVLTVDNAGHLTEFSTETVRIPGLTFTNDDGATNDVVLNMAYRYDENTDTGIFTETRGHADKLIIQDYNISGITSAKLANTDTIHGAFEKLQAQINAMDLSKVGGGTGEYLTDITVVDGIVTANKATLPSVTDSAVEGEFVSQVSETHGKIDVKRTAIVPSVTIGEGTADNAPTVNITINSKSATAQALTIATTGRYGVTKLTNDYVADGTSLAATGTAIKNAITTLKVGGDSNIGAAKTISSWKEEDGKVSITVQDIKIADANILDNAAIAISKIAGLQEALDSKEPNIPANTYDSYGSANSAKEALIGTVTDDKTTLTLNGLSTYIKSLEGTSSDSSAALTLNGLSVRMNEMKGREGDSTHDLTMYGLLAYSKAIEGEHGDSKDKLSLNGISAHVKSIEGTAGDTKDALTIYGLLAYIKELEAKIEELHPVEPEESTDPVAPEA